MVCDDCFKGVKHEGEPVGTIEKIDGVDCYIATPEGSHSNSKVLLFLPDAFGLNVVNSKLLADDFARNGIKTIIVDTFDGDALEESVFSAGNFDYRPWLAKHGEDAIRPLIIKVIDALKSQGVTELAATGYCFGGKCVFLLAIENIIKCSIVSHPSLLKLPYDLETYESKSNAPLLINACEFDQQFPKDAQQAANDIFGKSEKFTGKFKQTYWDGCTHGFAVKGDLSNPKIKAGKEGAFEAAVKWLKAHFLRD